MAKMKISRFQKYSPTFSFQSLQIMNIVTISINIAVWFLAFLHFFFKFESIIPKFAVWFASVRRISVSGPKPGAGTRNPEGGYPPYLKRKFSLASGMQKRPKPLLLEHFQIVFPIFNKIPTIRCFLTKTIDKL